ncbi:M20/M25/M40 family metallo-hydrolase [Taklimakanibacter deserti]|uniref:M20/M25/M40 family metallo-hydrolase n=1 Tax=Taklimakanibacter deserti TaxID=2267839 RepID=UPI000E64660C
MKSLDDVLQGIDGALDESVARLFELLRFPSVGTDPAFHGACRDAAAWLKRLLTEMGFTARMDETTGQPVVVAEYAPKGLPSHAPHILFYGHYDVQPPDPLDLWESPPFEPQLRKGADGEERIFARGACDDKGQLMTFLEASRAWLRARGSLPFRLTVLIEGDEEGDASHLDRYVARNRDKLKPDVVLICDTGMWNAKTPAITTRLRGCIAEEVAISGPSKDLHSGYYGGPARNPIRVLTKILGELHDRNGRVRLKGFYDGVDPVPLSTRRQWKSLNFPAKKYLGDVGLAIPAGEKAYAVYEQLWSRPTAEINGIYAGYTGTGSKTVVPAEAMAKLTFRLVGRQTPAQIRKGLRQFVKERLPADCKARFKSHGGDAMAVTVTESSPWVRLAEGALKQEWGRDPVLMADGASIPVVGTFKSLLKVDSLLVGFGLEDDSVHSPNEKYNLKSFHKGIRSWARLIGGLAHQQESMTS